MIAGTHQLYLPACVAGTVLLLLLLIARLRLHPALALMIAALSLGIASGMPLAQVPVSFTAGVGNLMGHIAIILGLGAILGRLLDRSGAAAALGGSLVELFGARGVAWAMLVLGIVVGMPVFFEVGLVLMMPIVVAAARRSGRPPILVAIPLLAGLSIMHGTVPPHPAAMLAATAYHADLGRTILFGLVVGIPAGILAGPGPGMVHFPQLAQKSAGGLRIRPPLPPGLLPIDGAWKRRKTSRPRPVPCARRWRSFCRSHLSFWAAGPMPCPRPAIVLNRALHFAGSPDVALLIAVLVALATLGPRIQTDRHHGPELLRKLTGESFGPIANAIVILSAAGGLSGVLRESGAAQATVSLAMGAHMPPLVLAWLLAAVVRVSMGSATVAMAVASGVLAPMAGSTGVRPELLVMATGCGSLMLSHVNDSGFWLVQSLFNLSPKQTLSTWSVVETVLSIAGLGMTLLLSVFMR